MTTDEGGMVGDYTADNLERILGEAAHVLRTIGFAGEGVTIIGGLVPSLLVPVVDPASLRPHVGTRDVDVCLSLALLEDGASGYQRIETELRRAGFRETDASFRWVGGASNTEVEFFCPAGDSRPAGRMYRPPPGRGRQTTGGKLSALALAAGDLLVGDRRIVTREVVLPDDRGRIEFDFPVTGPGGFLAAKAAALCERDKAKDAYDIVWLLDAWEGGPEGLAAEVAGYGRAEALSRLDALLSDGFASAERHGARAYARFLGADRALDDLARDELHAAGAVGAFLSASIGARPDGRADGPER